MPRDGGLRSTKEAMDACIEGGSPGELDLLGLSLHPPADDTILQRLEDNLEVWKSFDGRFQPCCHG